MLSACQDPTPSRCARNKPYIQGMRSPEQHLAWSLQCRTALLACPPQAGMLEAVPRGHGTAYPGPIQKMPLTAALATQTEIQQQT